MEKHKVVVFDKANRARVYTTTDVNNVPVNDGESVLVNPDLSYVRDCPVELWKLEGNLIVPMGEQEGKDRLTDLSTKSFIGKNEHHIKANLSALVDIPKKFELAQESLNLYKDMLWVKLDDLSDLLAKEGRARERALVDRMDLYRQQAIEDRDNLEECLMKSQKLLKLIVGIVVFVILLQILTIYLNS